MVSPRYFNVQYTIGLPSRASMKMMMCMYCDLHKSGAKIETVWISPNLSCLTSFWRLPGIWPILCLLKDVLTTLK